MTLDTDSLEILLVEDSRADARLLQILLEDTGAPLSITHVESMQAAVRALTDSAFHVALLDLGLPDGFGLENILRIGGLAPELPIIIMTGLDDSQTAEAARNHGAFGYLVKGSIDQGQELLEYIRSAVTQAQPATSAAPDSSAPAQSGIETDLDGNITSWSKEATDITGYEEAEMLGQPITRLIPESRRDEIALINGRLARGENLREFETVRLHRDGSSREVSLSVLSITDPNGNAVGSRTLIRDITELKRDRADAMQLAAIVASTDDAIVATTLDGAITHWNPGAEATLGYGAREMLGQPFLDIVPEDFRSRAEAMMQLARRGKPSPRLDGYLLHKQGYTMPMSISLSPIRDRGGGLVGAAILAGDITERKRAQAALEQEIREHAAANRELHEAQDQLVQAEKLASLGGLVAGVAHEINTPVGVGVTAASHLRRKLEDLREALSGGTLKRSQLDEFVRQSDQATQIILTNLNRAAELIQSFKQVAVDQSSSERREFNLRKYIDEILLSLRPKLKMRAIKVNIECDDDLVLDSLPGAYSQILTNLIMNSLTHAYDDQAAGTINIQARRAGDTLHLNYSDDGCGMGGDVRARIFDPFFTTRRGQGGSGLGMHIVYNLITQKLGGKVSVTSAPGEGMQLDMQLPVRTTTTEA